MKLRFPFLRRMKNESCEASEELSFGNAGATEIFEPPIGDTEELKRLADIINQENRAGSSGSVKGYHSDCFSYTEVKEMTPDEVRKNFSRIVDSMGKWN